MTLLFEYTIAGTTYRYSNRIQRIPAGFIYTSANNILSYDESIEFNDELATSSFTFTLIDESQKQAVLANNIYGSPFKIQYLIGTTKYTLFDGTFKSFSLKNGEMTLTAQSNFNNFNYQYGTKINDSHRRTIYPDDYCFSQVGNADAQIANLNSKVTNLQNTKNALNSNLNFFDYINGRAIAIQSVSSTIDDLLTASNTQLSYANEVKLAQDTYLPIIYGTVKTNGYPIAITNQSQGTYVLYVFSTYNTLDTAPTINKVNIYIDGVSYAITDDGAGSYYFVKDDKQYYMFFDTAEVQTIFGANYKMYGLSSVIIFGSDAFYGQKVELELSKTNSGLLQNFRNYIDYYTDATIANFSSLYSITDINNTIQALKIDTNKTIAENISIFLKDAFCVMVYDQGTFKVKRLTSTQTSLASITDDNMLDHPKFDFDYSKRLKNINVKFVLYNGNYSDYTQTINTDLLSAGYTATKDFEITSIPVNASDFTKTISTFVNFYNNSKTLEVVVNFDDYYTLNVFDVVSITSTDLSFVDKTFYIAKKAINLSKDEITLTLIEYDSTFFSSEFIIDDKEITIDDTLYNVTTISNIVVDEAVEVVTNLAVATFTVSWTHDYNYPVTYNINLSWTDGATTYSMDFTTREKFYKFIDYKSLITYTITISATNDYGYTSSNLSTTYFLNGLSYPPNDISEFYANIVGEMVYLWWSESSDIDVKYGGQFEIRHNTDSTKTWDNSAYIGKVQGNVNNFTTPYKNGAYYLKAIDSSGTYCTNANKIIVQDTQLINKNTVVTEVYDFFSLSASSSNNIDFDTTAGYAKMTVPTSLIDLWVTLIDDIIDFDFGDFYGLDLALPNTGYFVTPIYDLGKNLKSRFVIDYDFVSFLSNDTLDGREHRIDKWADFDSYSPNNNVSVKFYIATSIDNVTWTDYQLFQVADYTARYFKIKCVASSISININFEITKLNVIVDVPDIIESATFTSNASGVTKTIPLLNTFATIPLITASVNDMDSSNGYFTISNITTTSFDFVVYNINNKSVTYTAKGY